ncbi:MAG TPA: M20/M25/M40 family metallo-hydrolase [bacterium]|nr:M20/M25/M40 family metallo-hydrolase [bacterium]
MSRRLQGAAVALLLALLLLPAGLLATPSAPVLPDASAARALAHLRVLSEAIGPRAAGSAGDERAIAYVAGELAALGYGVERQAFPFLYFEEVRAPEFTVGADERVAAVTMLYSAASVDGGVEAELVAAGLGRSEDFAGRPVQGRIALVQRGEITFRQKVANAAAAGAAAVVIFNHQAGPPVVGTLSAPSRIPAVAISRDDGEALLRRLAGGALRARLVVRTIVEQRTSYNVIGVRRGAVAPDEIVVVGGHRDSVAGGPGANDNASGVAAALEAARLLAGVRTARTVHVVAFGAEELGLIGSQHYVRQATGRLVGMVNLDMVGRGRLQVGNSTDDDRLVELALAAGRQLGLTLPRFKLRGPSSDHAAFEMADVPAVFIHTGDDPAIHTPGDTADRIDGALLAQAARLAASIVLQAAGTAR